MARVRLQTRWVFLLLALLACFALAYRFVPPERRAHASILLGAAAAACALYMLRERRKALGGFWEYARRAEIAGWTRTGVSENLMAWERDGNEAKLERTPSHPGGGETETVISATLKKRFPARLLISRQKVRARGTGRSLSVQAAPQAAAEKYLDEGLWKSVDRLVALGDTRRQFHISLHGREFNLRIDGQPEGRAAIETFLDDAFRLIDRAVEMGL